MAETSFDAVAGSLNNESQRGEWVKLADVATGWIENITVQSLSQFRFIALALHVSTGYAAFNIVPLDTFKTLNSKGYFLGAYATIEGNYYKIHCCYVDDTTVHMYAYPNNGCSANLYGIK